MPFCIKDKMILLNTPRTSATLGFPHLSQAHLSPHPPRGPQGLFRARRGLPPKEQAWVSPCRPQWGSPESRLGSLFGRLKARGPGRVGEPRRRRAQSSVPPLGQLRPWGVWPAAEEARLLAHHGGRGRAGLQGGAHGKEPLGGQKGAGQGGGTHGCDGSGPTEAVLEAGVPSCFIGGEGDPALPSPHPTP